jgi:hypothetical protein
MMRFVPRRTSSRKASYRRVRQGGELSEPFPPDPSIAPDGLRVAKRLAVRPAH